MKLIFQINKNNLNIHLAMRVKKSILMSEIRKIAYTYFFFDQKVLKYCDFFGIRMMANAHNIGRLNVDGCLLFIDSIMSGNEKSISQQLPLIPYVSHCDR